MSRSCRTAPSTDGPCSASATAAPPRSRPRTRCARSARPSTAGVDLIEFDVLDLPTGPLVLAHSDHLDEVSHGAATGRVRDLSLERAARGRAGAADASTTRSRSSSTRRRTSGSTSISSCARGSTSSRRRSCATGSTSARSSAAFTSPSLQAVARAAPRRQHRAHLSGGQALDLPQAVPVADRLARARVDAGVGAAPPAAARPPRRGERRDAPAPARDRGVGRARARRRAAGARLDGRRAGRSRARRRGRRRRRDHERSPDLRGYTERRESRGDDRSFLGLRRRRRGSSRSCSRLRRAQARTTARRPATTTRRPTARDRRPTTAPTTTTTDDDDAAAAAAEADRGRRHGRRHARRRPDRRRGEGDREGSGSRGRSRSSAARGAPSSVTPSELGAPRTSSEAVKLAARVKRPGFVVPLKVDVSRPKVERLVAVARQALPSRPRRRDAEAAQPEAVRDEGRPGPPAQGARRSASDRPRAEDAAARPAGAPVRDRSTPR